MSIVLITTGKHESVYTAEVRIFSYQRAAEEFCEKTSTGYTKHWVNAEIVADGEKIDLSQPEEE